MLTSVQTIWEASCRHRNLPMKTSVWLAAVGYLDLRGSLLVAVLWWIWRLMKSWIKQLQLMVCSPFKLIAEYPHSPDNSSTAHSKQWQPLIIIGSQTLDPQCRALSVISSLEVLVYNSEFRFYKRMRIRTSGWQSIGVLVRRGIITVDRSLSVCGGRGLNVVWNCKAISGITLMGKLGYKLTLNTW